MKHSLHTMYRLFKHFSCGHLPLWINILSYLDGKYNFDQYIDHDFKVCSNLSGFVSKFIIESSLLSFENDENHLLYFSASKSDLWVGLNFYFSWIQLDPFVIRVETFKKKRVFVFFYRRVLYTV